MKDKMINIFNFKVILLKKRFQNSGEMLLNFCWYFNIKHHMKSAIGEPKTRQLLGIVEMIHFLVDHFPTGIVCMRRQQDAGSTIAKYCCAYNIGNGKVIELKSGRRRFYRYNSRSFTRIRL